jgi:sRNA-binding carbon storage regulator CsrA
VALFDAEGRELGRVFVTDIGPNRVRLRIVAPRHIAIARGEIAADWMPTAG